MFYVFYSASCKRTPSPDHASPAQGYTPTLNSPIPIYTLGWKEAQWELSVLSKNATAVECINHEATITPSVWLELSLNVASVKVFTCKHRFNCTFKLMHNKYHTDSRLLSRFTTYLGTYMINIKLLRILSRLCSFALFNDNLFNKLFVSGPLKYKYQNKSSCIKEQTYNKVLITLRVKTGQE